MEVGRKVWVALVVLATAGRVRVLRRRLRLPDLVARLGEPGRWPRADAFLARTLPPPRPLGRAVHRVLGGPPFRARCLTNALVLHRLLRIGGRPCELVIGSAEVPTDKDAHAWIEVDGFDVGPPPGRMGLLELVRYGGPSVASASTVAGSSS